MAGEAPVLVLDSLTGKFGLSLRGQTMTDQIVRPTDAELHAYKAVHHAEYLRVTARDAGGTNRLIHTTELPTEENGHFAVQILAAYAFDYPHITEIEAGPPA